MLILDVSIPDKVNFQSVSQINIKGELQIVKWQETKFCEGKIEKSVLVIQPLMINASEVLQQAQGMSILSVELKNNTKDFEYSTSSSGSKSSAASSGINLVVEDLQCDITKSLVKDLSKEIERPDLMELLQQKGDKLFDVEIIHGV